MTHDYNKIGQRWIAIWNDANAASRQQAVANIWSKNATHYAPGFEATGLAEIAVRVESVYDRFINKMTCTINGVDYAGYDNVLRILWEIAPIKGGPALATGCEILTLNTDGTVQLDYQFNDPQPQSK